MQCLFPLHLTAVNLQARFYQTWQRGRGVKGIVFSQVLWKSAAVWGRGAWLILPQRCCSVSARLLRDQSWDKSPEESRLGGPAAHGAICFSSGLTDYPGKEVPSECISHSWFLKTGPSTSTGSPWDCFLIPELKGTQKFVVVVICNNQRMWLILNLLGTEQELYLEHALLLP